jgi:hypothetical protein
MFQKVFASIKVQLTKNSHDLWCSEACMGAKDSIVHNQRINEKARNYNRM